VKYRLPSLTGLLVSGVLLPVLTLFVLLTWLTLTSAGASWLLSLVPGLTVQQVRGNLASGLQLRGLHYAHGKAKLQAQQLDWHFHPYALLWGEARFSDLELAQAQVWLPTAKPRTQALRLALPKLPGWLDALQLRVAPLQVRNLRIYEGSHESFALQDGSCTRLAWQRGTLVIRALKAKGSFGHVQLSGQITPGRDSVQALGQWQSNSKTANSATLQVHWTSLGGNRFGGPLTLNAQVGKENLHLQSEVEVAPYSLQLAKIQVRSNRLSQPALGNIRLDLPKTLHGDYRSQGQLLDIRWPGIPPSLQAKSVALHWDGKGNASNIAGDLRVIAGNNDLRSTLSGNAQQLQVAIQGRLLQGQILPSRFLVTLHKTKAVQGKLSLRQLPLQVFAPKVPGQISADIAVDVSAPRAVWQGKVQWQILPSVVYRQALQGQGQLQFAGKQWRLIGARLQGPGLQLQANGSLDTRLQLQAQVARWGGILPGMQGTTHVQGWLGKAGKNWQGQVDLQGSSLHYRQYAVGKLDLNASLSAQQQLAASLTAAGIVAAGQTLAVQSKLAGSLQQANLQLHVENGARQLQMSGVLLHPQNAWGLQLDQLHFDDPRLGAWQMVHPSNLRWAQGTAQISGLQIDGPHDASLHVDGGYGPAPNQGHIDAVATALPLDFWDKSAEAGIRGRWDAQIQGNCHGSCTLQAHWQVHDTALHWQDEDKAQALGIEAFSGQVAWQASGLQLHSQLRLADHLGHLQLEASSPAPLALPWHTPSKAPIAGVVVGEIPGQLLAHLPAGTIRIDPTGQIALDLHAGGTWGQPDWRGQAKASALGCYIPQAGLHLQNIGAELQGQGEKLTLQNLVVHSGAGSLTGNGTITFAHGLAYQVHIAGDNFQALNLPQVQASVNPQLQIQQEKGRTDITGTVQTSELRILGTDFGGPKPSSDVVFVRNEKQKPTPSNLAASIHIGLGKNAKILIGGLRANLEGSLDLRITPPSTSPEMHGTLQMVDGKYDIYGNSLIFQRGRIIFAGPPDAASLDVLAVRKIRNSNSFAVNNETIYAGVQVTGNLSHPVVNLYSKPGMAQNDILSYLVLGTPSSGLQSQDALLSAAAGQLFSAGRAAVFGNGGLGGSGLDVGVSSNGNSSGLAADMVTLGHYITPNLYFSVGQSILGQGTIARLRYRVSRHIEIQTESGTQDGANIFYRIDF